MIIKPIRTRLLVPPKDNLYAVLATALPKLAEKDIVTITSKIVSIGEGRCIPTQDVANKDDLIRREADRYLPRNVVKNAWVMHTLTNNMLIPTAGIDESNAKGHYILWPEDPKASARRIHAWLCKTYQIKNVGVIITDSHSIALRRGTVGISLAHYGFRPVNDYRQTHDLFDRELKITQSNVADGLAAAAVVCQGEGSEQVPVTVISDVSFVKFSARPWRPRRAYSSFEIAPEEDLYFPLLKGLGWKKGGGGE